MKELNRYDKAGLVFFVIDIVVILYIILSLVFVGMRYGWFIAPLEYIPTIVLIPLLTVVLVSVAGAMWFFIKSVELTASQEE